MREIALKSEKLIRILRVPTWRRSLFRERVAAGAEHGGVLRTLPAFRTIIDVGANRGQFTLAARHFFPDSQIIAFEPLPKPAAIWRALFADDPRAVLVRAALGSQAGHALINISGRDDSSSLLPITDSQNLLFPGTAQVDTETVEVVRLAEYLPADGVETPALLKIDVQGFELEALAGCEDCLDVFDWVYVECSFIELYQGQALAHEVIAWLHQRGFELRGVHHLSYDAGRAVQADFLFSRLPSR